MSKALEVNENSFDTEVMKSQMPIMVDFWASWCMPCKMLAPTIDEVAAAFEGKAKVVKVDVDSNQPLAAKYGIRSIPTLLIFKDGQVIDTMVGGQTKADIAAKLNKLLGA